jgi:Na+/H+-dicarboxylate symporter
VYGVELGGATLLAVIITTVGASIGTPSTPGVGIVILATILQGIGVPESGIALIIGVDCFLEWMCHKHPNWKK